MNYNKSIKIAFLSTYPPRECGIATFTQDLFLQMSESHTMRQSSIIAVSNGSLSYDNKVHMELMQNDRSSYSTTADKLNKSDIDLLVIEHEFGIYGGECGAYLLDFIDKLSIPFVATLHTVLPEPNIMQRYILKTLGQKSKKIITMAKNTDEILKSVYRIDPSKIVVINHGVPSMRMESREILKKQSKLEDRFIISTFGLLGPGKGLEYGVEAIAKVAKDHKEVLYFILGQTHPTIIKESGENYRSTLEAMVEKLGIKDNVRFVNKYMTKAEIIHYLILSDVYLTPYLNKDQAVSGTLAYAVGYGRVVVSTPYSYAKEMLAEGRGLLAEFKDSESIAGCIEYILNNPEKQRKMEQKTLEIGKSMMWENVGAEYRNLFIDIIMNNGNKTKTDGRLALSNRKVEVAG